MPHMMKISIVLPILEALTSGHLMYSTKAGYGRTPCLLVLLPTRELAKQVHVDFEAYGQAVGLSVCCVYGGAPMRDQGNAVKRGVDIIVGTPGRVKDLIERNSLDLKALKFRAFDEADEMLNMGVVDDVEFILGCFFRVQEITPRPGVQMGTCTHMLNSLMQSIYHACLKDHPRTI